MTTHSHATTDAQLQGVVVVGLDDHEQLNELIQSRPALDYGYTPPIYLMEPDLHKARDAALTLGLGEDNRFSGFFGPNAGREFIASLASRLDEIVVPTQVQSCGNHDPHLKRWVEQELNNLRDEQRRRVHSRKQVIASRASHRDHVYWAHRFQSIREGEPARILIVTTRFSTYMQHASKDLGEALKRMGHQVTILEEPDAYTMMSPQISIKAHLDVDPDIVITTNYPRATRPELFPQGCVNVCWIQDAMPHLFNSMPKEVSSLDFIIGYLYPGAAATRVYPADQQLSLPMPVSELKFHPGPVSDALRENYSCDIAYISHQSKPVDELCQDLSDFVAPEHHPLLDKVFRWAKSVVDQYEHTIFNLHIGTFVEEFRDEIASLGNPEGGQLLWHQFAYPLLERMLRHQMLEWAKDIAQHNDLRFRVYGRGWDRHPTLAAHAHPEIPHGEALRASYQCAKVQLHASSQGVRHQRQYECAFSGGLMLSRRDWHEFVRRNWEDALAYTQSGAEPDACLIEGRLPCFSLRNHSVLDKLTRERDRMPPYPILWENHLFPDVFLIHPEYYFVDQWADPDRPFIERALRMLSDPYAMTFATREDFESSILRACSDHEWRQTHSARTREAMVEHVSMNRFASQLMGFLCDRMTHTVSMHQVEAIA